MIGSKLQFFLGACLMHMGTLPSPAPPSIVCRVSVQQGPKIMIDTLLRHQRKM